MGRPKDSKADERHDKDRQFYLSVAAFVLSIVTFAVNTYLSGRAQRTADSAYASRVELMEFTNNDNGHFSNDDKPCDSCWRPYEYDFGSDTGTVGVQRHVVFKQAFDKDPQVSCSFLALTVPDVKGIVERLGYVIPEGSRERISLASPAVRVDASEIQKNGFELAVSVALPQPVKSFLRDKLSKKELVDRTEAAHKYTNREIQHRYDDLKPDEIWMLNFQVQLGTFDVSCVAQAQQKTPSQTP